MGEYAVKRPVKRPPIHPGEIVREDVLPALGLSVSEAARRLGISRQQLHRVLACTHPITTEMALRIGKLAGNGPGLWLRMQQAMTCGTLSSGCKRILPGLSPQHQGTPAPNKRLQATANSLRSCLAAAISGA